MNPLLALARAATRPARQAWHRARRPRGPAAHAMSAYAQQGEDQILRTLLQYRPDPGFYVDVGAHHPWHFSNTYAFYRRGWRGINVDATPGSMRAFEKARPRDVNVECAVASERRLLVFREFDNPEMNGLCDESTDLRGAPRTGREVRRTEMVTRTLADVLDAHLPPGQHVDFLSVDVEGFDLDVLRSNDWDRYRPSVVVAEDITVFYPSDVAGSELARYLDGIGYGFCAKSVHSHLFVDRSQVTFGSDHSVRVGPKEST